MKRVLITGASGFVGANLARRILSDGHEAHLILRPNHQPWRLDEIASDVRRHEADVADRDAIAAVVRKVRPDWVFHLAAYGAYSQQTGIEQMIATNLQGAIALLDACADQGVEAFVQTGSSAEYGYKDHAAEEGELVQPNSHYAITKVAATHYAHFTAAKRGVNASTLRLYSIFGPYEEPERLIPTLICHGFYGQLPPLVSPRTARDFVYVDDAIEALLKVAAAKACGKVYNVSSGIQTTLEKVVETARRLMNIEVEPVWATMEARSWDTDVWLGAPDHIRREISWQSQIDFESGLKKTIDWLCTHPRWNDFYRLRVLRFLREKSEINPCISATSYNFP